MNKEQALKNAKEFIEDLLTSIQHQTPTSETISFISDKVLDDDPNLEVLQSELNKIGFEIKQDNKPNWFIITKISK